MSKKSSTFAALNGKCNIGTRTRVLSWLLLVVLLSMPLWCSAKPRNNSTLVWTRHTDALGRYTGRYLFVARGVTVTLGANYYYGDVDYSGRAFKEGFQTDNLLGGLTLAYQHPLGSWFNLRSQVGFGALRGAADSVYKGFPMSFRSLYMEPAMCVDYFPFANMQAYGLGLYIFIGIGANVSLIEYDFGNPPYEHVRGNALRCLPIVPCGIGWAFPLGRASGLMLNLELSLHQGILDTPVMNLDAYPQTKAQNGVRDYGLSRKPSGKRNNEWTDGYFQGGISLSYRWR